MLVRNWTDFHPRHQRRQRLFGIITGFPLPTALKGIDEDPKLNKALWHMAEVFRSQGIALSLTQFRWTDYRQPNSHCRPFTDFALHFDIPAVQIDAALDDHQTKTRA